MHGKKRGGGFNRRDGKGAIVWRKPSRKTSPTKNNYPLRRDHLKKKKGDKMSVPKKHEKKKNQQKKLFPKKCSKKKVGKEGAGGKRLRCCLGSPFKGE